jgi:cation diffusion facilitator CzcD-associated flavoprotein CzcO
MDASDRVVILGAGPYGLSVAAHLRARGIETSVFGRPMSFWEENMPRGMLLRSAWRASSISDPGDRLTLDEYERQTPGLQRPLPREDFISYGHWFQRQVVPDLDRRLVATVERSGDRFAVELEDGQHIDARRVVIATGLKRFAHRPEAFEGLNSGAAVHAVEVTEPQRFRGRSVAVIGSGQSAVETAALASEAGGDVELIARAPLIRWLTRSARMHARSEMVATLLYAPTDVGPPGLSWVVALPNAFRRLPEKTQGRVAYRSIRPAAAGWLVDRTADVKLTLGRHVVGAEQDASGVRLTLDDGSVRQVDEVVLGTGYAVDVAREPVIGPSIRADLKVKGGYPVLMRGFESSVDRLHFVGAYAALSFGPIMRFVSGTRYTARNVAMWIARDV